MFMISSVKGDESLHYTYYTIFCEFFQSFREEGLLSWGATNTSMWFGLSNNGDLYSRHNEKHRTYNIGSITKSDIERPSILCLFRINSVTFLFRLYSKSLDLQGKKKKYELPFQYKLYQNSVPLKLSWWSAMYSISCFVCSPLLRQSVFGQMLP